MALLPASLGPEKLTCHGAPSDPVSHFPGKGEKQSHGEITPRNLQGTLLVLGCDSHPHWPGQRAKQRPMEHIILCAATYSPAALILFQEHTQSLDLRVEAFFSKKKNSYRLRFRLPHSPR